MSWLDFLEQTALAVTILWALAFAATAALRRSPAALRHFIWTVALGASVLLPAAALRPPARSTAALAGASPTVITIHAAPAHVRAPAPPPPRRIPANWPLFLWLAGFTAIAGRFLLGAARASWMTGCANEFPSAQNQADRLARALGIRRKLRVLSCAAAPIPMTWGIFRPVVLLPADAAAWPAARLTAVLLHELTHVRRLDLVAQAIGQLACCLYWFHPLAWLAAARLRREREAACDDAVLLRGIPAPEYAGHLMELARSLAAARRARSDAPAMAEAGDLEARVRALLDRRRPRGPLSRRAALAVTIAAAACLLPLTLRTAHAQSARGSLSGTVQDPSGAFVPFCHVAARNLDGQNEEITRANAAGQYSFASIPAGRYSLEFRTPGFKARIQQAVVAAGAQAQSNALLEIGGLTESVTVTAAKPLTAPAPRASGAAPQRIRVGGNVQMCRLITQVRPIYPFDAQQEGVQGAVLIHAIISKTGELLSANVANTDVDPRLAKAALDAVNQWKYQPTLLNGHPVEVLTDIDVTFELN